jgi:hypothetical protein
LECEICKQQYPRSFSFHFLSYSIDRFTIDGKTYDAITLPKYNGAYIIIDILNKETY